MNKVDLVDVLDKEGLADVLDKEGLVEAEAAEDLVAMKAEEDLVVVKTEEDSVAAKTKEDSVAAKTEEASVVVVAILVVSLTHVFSLKIRCTLIVFQHVIIAINPVIWLEIVPSHEPHGVTILIVVAVVAAAAAGLVQVQAVEHLVQMIIVLAIIIQTPLEKIHQCLGHFPIPEIELIIDKIIIAIRKQILLMDDVMDRITMGMTIPIINVEVVAFVVIYLFFIECKCSDYSFQVVEMVDSVQVTVVSEICKESA